MAYKNTENHCQPNCLTFSNEIIVEDKKEEKVITMMMIMTIMAVVVIRLSL
jgi:hypothetical protein